MLREKMDCNRCDRNCKGRSASQQCENWHEPIGTFMLAELLLDHPQSTHDTLSSLPFDVNLDFILK